MATLLGPHVLARAAAGQARALTGRSFFPHLISGPFHTALVYAFVFAIVRVPVAAVASLLRGGKYHHVETPRHAAAVRRRAVTSRGWHERRGEASPIESCYRIGEVAERLGVTTRTIRYYEELGLLGPDAGRARAPTALYSEADVARLQELIRLRDLLGLIARGARRARRRRRRRAPRCAAGGPRAQSDAERLRIVEEAIRSCERQLELVRARQERLAEFAGELVAKLESLRRYREKSRAGSSPVGG